MPRRPVLRYIELKSGHGDHGPAWIDLVHETKSRRGIYFQDRLLLRANGVSGNFIDTNTGEEFWVSSPKRNGEDRHWAGGGPVEITQEAEEVYRRHLEGDQGV